jgi:hypothetical protein
MEIHGGTVMAKPCFGEQEDNRFDQVPDGLREEIGHIVDSSRLHVLLRAAIRSADLESLARCRFG